MIQWSARAAAAEAGLPVGEYDSPNEYVGPDGNTFHGATDDAPVSMPVMQQQQMPTMQQQHMMAHMVQIQLIMQQQQQGGQNGQMQHQMQLSGQQSQ